MFAELATDLDLTRHHDPRTPVVHLFTHAALYIPREMVQAVQSHAHISAVFMLPSGGQLDLDYLDLLDAHWVVDHATVASGAARASAAKAILGEKDRQDRPEEEVVPHGAWGPAELARGLSLARWARLRPRAQTSAHPPGAVRHHLPPRAYRY